MIYKNFGNTNLKISSIGLGTWVFGSDNWSGSEEKESLMTVENAIDLGINFIDTAPIYGDGLSERIIGKAIKGKRDKVIIATKCGLMKKGKAISICLKPDFLKEELENSLKRLGLDVIDLYQIHWPDPHTPLEDTLAQLKNFQTQGKIRYIGVSNFNYTLVNEAIKIHNIVSVQNQYSIIKRDVEQEMLPFLKKQNIAFIAYGGLAGGILSCKYKEFPKFSRNDCRSFFYGFSKVERYDRFTKLFELLKTLANQYHKTPAQVALNWILQKSVTCVITGARKPEQVIDNVESCEWQLDDHDIELIDQLKV